MCNDYLARSGTRASGPRAATGAIVLLIATVACDVRRDSDGTLARVRGGTMRVGAVENKPWTTLPAGGGGAGGIEGALVAELARELGARIEWMRAPESQLLEALELRELDLVIGGLTDAAPWKQRVAFTKPIYTDTIVVGGPQAIGPLRNLEGRTVAVWAGDPAVAAYVRRKGGIPRMVPDLGHWPGLVAAPTWRLSALGFTSIGITLRTRHHVIAALPGDKAWLAHVEQSVRVRTPIIGELLKASRP